MSDNDDREFIPQAGLDEHDAVLTAQGERMKLRHPDLEWSLRDGETADAWAARLEADVREAELARLFSASSRGWLSGLADFIRSAWDLIEVALAILLLFLALGTGVGLALGAARAIWRLAGMVG